jgi:hypothetical protein
MEASMVTNDCAGNKRKACCSLLVIGAFALVSMPVGAQRITVDMLNNHRPEELIRGHFDRSPDKSVHHLSAAERATAKAAVAAASAHGPARPPVYSFFEPSSRSNSVNYGFMVGTSPFSKDDVHGSSVHTFVVPLVFKVHQVATDFGTDANGNLILTGITNKDATFDVTKPAPACLGSKNNVPFKLAVESPVFESHRWVWGGTDLGDTQYVDAFQRANFWRALGEDAEDYHVRLKPVDVLPPVVLDFPTGSGIGLPQSSSFLGYSACAPTVLVDFNYFDELLDYIVIPKLAAEGVNASNFPMFIGGNVIWGQVIGTLPIFFGEASGYHSLSDLDPAQNYGVAAFGDDNVLNWPDAVVLSHEVGEWMNDPTGSNYVQLYDVNALSPTGPVACQGNYETGDILAGTFMPPVVGKNGYSYTIQELAFFSYFYGGPSLAVHGWYSNNDTLKTDAGPVCGP